MATSAIGIPYPVAADNNDTATALLNLVNWLDPVIESSYTSAEITALSGVQLWAGRRLYDSTKGCFRSYLGGAWIDEQGVVLNPQAASYTLVLADANNKHINQNNAGAINLNVPTNASVAFTVGTVISGHQYGAGQITVVAVTPGTTNIRCPGGANKTRLQYSAWSLLKLATDEWLLSGDLV